MRGGRLSKADKVLNVLYNLYCEGYQSVPVEYLAVKCHSTYPGEFCLNGYPQYVDNNKIGFQLSSPALKSYVRRKNGMVSITAAGIIYRKNLNPEGANDA